MIGATEGEGKPARGDMRLARICVPSWRQFRRFVYYGSIYEGQDVLADIDDIDLICPRPGRGFRFIEPWLLRLAARDISGRLAYMNPGLGTVRLERDYDLFLALCQNWVDLFLLNAVKGWKARCRTSICWIDDLWAPLIPKYKNWIHVLDRFDHIIVNLKSCAQAVERALGRPCHWIPEGIDTLRFSPFPNPPARVIDVYSVGRRWPGIHRSLLDLSSNDGVLYIYDSAGMSAVDVPDHKEHRRLISSLAKRSRFFLVAPGKMDASWRVQGQSEVGARYFEGAAAGAVLIGTKPEGESFRLLFGWPDAVIEINPDGTDLAGVISGLSQQPDRLREISRRNSRETLLRHDWAYRWEEILALAGLQPRPAMEARKIRLRQLADIAASPSDKRP